MKPVKLDWRAYYKLFNELHGGSPVLYKGTLLYQDGWRYKIGSYEGPEYIPLNDFQRIHLSLTYWRRRKVIIENELKQLTDIVDSIRQLQSERSQPLQQTLSLTMQDEHGVSSPATQTVDLTIESLMEGKGTELNYDLDHCKIEIRVLKSEYVELKSKGLPN